MRNEFNHLMELHAKRLNKGSPPCIEDLVVAEESCWKFSKKKVPTPRRQSQLLSGGALGISPRHQPSAALGISPHPPSSAAIRPHPPPSALIRRHPPWTSRVADA